MNLCGGGGAAEGVERIRYVDRNMYVYIHMYGCIYVYLDMYICICVGVVLPKRLKESGM
jgi:hypothetical protein